MNDSIAGMDLFDSDATYRKFMQKLIAGYALDALEGAGDNKVLNVKEGMVAFVKELLTSA